MSRRRARRGVGLVIAVLVGLVGLVGLVAGAGVASADPGSAKPTLSDLRTGDGQVSALLTFPASGSAPRVDQGSLRASLGSGPSGPVTVTPVARERRAAMLVVDTSGSMAGAGLAAAKSAARSFLDQVPADVRVGLAGFAARPHLLVAPTHDRAKVLAALGGLHASGGTALYDAVRLASRSLDTSGGRTLVLLSDGGDTNSRAGLSSALAAVRASGVRTVAIGFHTSTSQYAVLNRIAAAGHGTMTAALDPRSLRSAFGSAARQLATQLRITATVPAGLGGAQRLRVSGTVDGHPFTTGTAVTLPEASAAAAPKPSVPAGSTGSAGGLAWADAPVTMWIAAGAVFLGLLVGVLSAFAPMFTGAARRRIRALDRYVGTSPVTRERARATGQDLTGTLLRAGDAWARARSQSARTGLLLERADLPLRLNEWYVLRVVFTVVAMAVCWMFLHGSTAGAVAGLLIGLALAVAVPSVLLRVLAGRRARRFEVQLPDVLTLMASSLSTGFSLPQALDAIVRDAAEPASKEFARALAETRIGADLEDALDHTATRMDSLNLAWTNMAVRIQRHVGGNLAETLRTTAATLRERESLRRQVRALSAEGRLSAYVLAGLPVFLAAYLWLTNRDYLSLLWSRPLGLVMLAFSGVLLVVGMVWMRRVVTVEV